MPGLERKQKWVFKNTASSSPCLSISSSSETHTHTPTWPQTHSIARPSPHRSFSLPFTTLSHPPPPPSYTISPPPPSLLSHTKHTHLHILTYLQLLCPAHTLTHSHILTHSHTHTHNTIFPTPPSCCFFSVLLRGSWHRTVTVYCIHGCELCGYTHSHIHTHTHREMITRNINLAHFANKKRLPVKHLRRKHQRYNSSEGSTSANESESSFTQISICFLHVM